MFQIRLGQQQHRRMGESCGENILRFGKKKMVHFLGGVGGRCGCDFARKVTRRVFFFLDVMIDDMLTFWPFLLFSMDGMG